MGLCGCYTSHPHSRGGGEEVKKDLKDPKDFKDLKVKLNRNN